MKIMITDSKGDSISITIGNNGSFGEFNKHLEKGTQMHMDFEKSLNEGDSDVPNMMTNCLPSDATSSKNFLEECNKDDKARNSNLELLKEQVESCVNQIQMEPGDNERSTNNCDIKVSISPKIENEDDQVYDSISFCRLCANRGNDMVYIFDKNECHENIIEMIEDCLPIAVARTDTLPKEACRSCLDKLELCYEFHRTVAEAEKRFLIMGGKIPYDSDKTAKYCQTVGKDCLTRSSSTEDSEKASAVDSAEESTFEDNISDLKRKKFCNPGKKEAREEKEVLSAHEGAGENALADSKTVDSKMTRCQICGADYRTVKKCQTHSRSHFSDNYYPCCLCDEIFTVKKDWDEHSIEHKQSRNRNIFKKSDSHICGECGKKFVTEARLSFHQLYHNPNARPYHCESCDTTLDSESTLYRHLQTVHGQGTGFPCHICGKRFKVQASVNAHQRKHRYVRSFECDICMKRLYSKDTLEMHKETHSNSFNSTAKNFSCLYCGKSFSEKAALTLHIMKHAEEGDQSENSNKTKRGVETEKKDCGRPNPADKPFRCNICGRTFDHSARLREHSSVHTGKRPYSCSLCDKSFKRANARKVHMIIHTGEKPYKCNICGTNFRRAGDMRRHKKTQHGQNE